MNKSRISPSSLKTHSIGLSVNSRLGNPSLQNVQMVVNKIVCMLEHLF